MSSLSTLPKGDSAWLLRKSIQRIMQQVSVLETNIGSSTTGNSADTQVIFNDAGTLRGDTGLTFNKTTDTLGTGRLTTSGDAIVCSSTGDFYVGTTISPQFKVERATGAATITGALTGQSSASFYTGTALPLHIRNSGTSFTQIGDNGTIGAGTAFIVGSSDASLRFQCGGAEQMRLNSTGLGVGINPIYKLHVKSDLSELYFRDNGTASELLINSETGGKSALYFGDVADTVRGGIVYDSATDSLDIRGYNNIARLQIDSSGNVGIGITPSAGGGCLQLKSGITFPATQVASSDANTLDDYEEGTFTATLKGTVSDPTTPVTTTARYTKIGRVVTVTIQFSSVTTTGASGRIQIDGLPFTNNSSLAGTGSVGFNGMATFTGSPFASLSASSSTIAMFASNSAGAYTAVTFNAGTTQDLWTSLTYTV